MVAALVLSALLLLAAGLLAWRRPALRAWSVACVLLAGTACLAAALWGPPGRLSPTRDESLHVPDLASISPRSFYPDDRLFVARYGTGLDPSGAVAHLPGYVQTLPELHERYVDDFVRRPGFGEG